MAVATLIDTWLTEHVAEKTEAPIRYTTSVKHLLRFFEHERRVGHVKTTVMVSDINKRFVDRFIRFRKGEGVGGWTINRDLKALRGALNHGWKNEMILSVPFVHDVEAKDKAKPRDLVYTPERVAALLEAAAGREDRAHLFLYIMIALSTCGRSEAILELDAEQIRDGRIFFLADDRQQTKKRRSVVPIAPTLAPWLDGLKGKVIVSRKPKAERNWADPEVPEFFEYPCYDVGRSFESCLIEAGICTEVYDKEGEQRFHPIRHKLGETAPRPVLKGMGTPNTLRHTIITEMHRRGVPEAQIDAAAGHVGDGTGKRNYRHLRPDYLGELIAGVEAYWAEIARYTTVHMRSQSGPKIINLSSARASARIKGK